MCDELRQIARRAGANARNDLACRNVPDRRALPKRMSRDVSVEKATGIGVPGTRRVDHPMHRGGLDFDQRRTADDQRSSLAQGDRCDLTEVGDPRRSVVKARRLEQRTQLMLVGEEDVDIFSTEIEEFIAKPIDEEGVAQREGEEPTGRVHSFDGNFESLVGVRFVPQVPFDVGDLRRCKSARIHIGNPQPARRPEKRTHGSLGVGCHVDQTSSGRRRL